MPWRDFLEKLNIPERLYYYATAAGLVIVLINNHVYLSSVQSKDRAVRERELRASEREEQLVRREAILKAWETEILKTSYEVRDMMRKRGDSSSREEKKHDWPSLKEKPAVKATGDKS